MSLGKHVVVMIAIAAGSAILIGFLLWLILGHPSLHIGGQWNADDSFNFAKIVLTIVGGIGAIVALVVAYRKQKLGENADRREEVKLLNERFAKAVEQLGSDKAAVRLAGVYAIGTLADDWRDGQQMCIDVLCAYLRMPYKPPPYRFGKLPRAIGMQSRHQPGSKSRHGSYLPQKGSDTRSSLEEQQVRQAVVRLIREHLKPDSRSSWQGRNFDFFGAIFDGEDFRGARFSGGRISFMQAQFLSGEVYFFDVEFAGAAVSFYRARFRGGLVFFSGSKVTGGRLDFTGAEFESGGVYFPRVEFSGGEVNFFDAEFRGSEVIFKGSRFIGGEVDLSQVAAWSRPPEFDDWDAIPEGVEFPPLPFDPHAREPYNYGM